MRTLRSCLYFATRFGKGLVPPMIRILLPACRYSAVFGVGIILSGALMMVFDGMGGREHTTLTAYAETYPMPSEPENIEAITDPGDRMEGKRLAGETVEKEAIAQEGLQEQKEKINQAREIIQATREASERQEESAKGKQGEVVKEKQNELAKEAQGGTGKEKQKEALEEPSQSGAGAKPAQPEKKESETSGQPLTVVDCSLKDYEVLKRIVEAEAGVCDTKGRILVANVVINRVKSSQFPDTIAEVVYQKSQFSPVSNGSLNSCTVTPETIEAVNRALAGEDYSQGALYFMNRSRSRSNNISWFDQSLTYLFQHDRHEFFK